MMDFMKRMDSDNVFQLTVTSPPYDSLRSYNDEVKWNFDIFKEIGFNLHDTMIYEKQNPIP